MKQSTHRPIQIGQMVRLKSGGPLMTVDDASWGREWREFRCVWFEGTHIRKAWFGQHLLDNEVAETKAA